MTTETGEAAETGETAPERRVSYVASTHFATILRELNVSLLVTTYQAGKMAVIGTHADRLDVSFHNFELAMGVAVHSHQIAVGSRQQIYFLQDARELAARIEPAGKYDGCWLARRSHFTGNIHGHEMAYCGDQLWVVNTLFSCLCTLDDRYHFVPRWLPPFITPHFQAEDRCHLNGLAVENGHPRFVTAMAETDSPQGWRPTKSHSGCVVDVTTGETLTRGLAMPHSPRVVQGRLLVLDSGRGELVWVDRTNGKQASITSFPGYARGFGVAGPFAFIGLSKIRETAVFGGVPIAENRAALKCGVALVDLRIGQTVATFEFTEGVEEIFAVEVISGTRCPALRGPHITEDGTEPIWVIPPPDHVSSKLTSTAAPSSPGNSHSFRTAAAVPSWTDLLHRGQMLHRQGRASEAVEVFRAATSLHGASAELFNEFGNALQDVGQQEAALEAYRRAVAIDPDYSVAHQNIGYLQMNFGDPDDAVKHYAAAQRVAPSPMNRVLMATTLPVIYESAADLEQRRAKLTENVRQLVADGVRINTHNTLIPTTFFLAYQGGNDRELLKDLARVYTGPNLVKHEDSRRTSKRLRVGFLSAYFRDHTIGRLNLGRIQRLSRDRLEVFVISATAAADEFATRFRQAADHYVVLPRQAAVARQMIADLKLDVLVFADVGMDALASTLAYSRMAPIQCATWGHPNTTGSPMIDYFVSSELAEETNADSHYSERLVKLPSLGIHYERPTAPAARPRKSDFGLDDYRTLYLCPQTLFKFHPEFDDLLSRILREDQQGELVIVEGRVPMWTRRLEDRFRRVMPDVVSRIRFVPAVPQPRFLQLLATADVILDPVHFGGGNSTLEALAMGTPVVTWPSAFLRGRLSAAMYRRMGWTEPVVASGDTYVQTVLRLTQSPADAQRCRAAISSASGVLFGDETAAPSWEEFFQMAVETS